jgi:hypothetical protein
MKTGRSLIALVCILAPVAAPANGLDPTAFTVQGYFSAGGTPVTGLVDLEAELWDSPSGGVQIGPTETVTGLAVADGRFEVEFDFGDVFTGVPVWLELRARPSGVGPFATLEPRRRMYSTPHAAHAHRVIVADLALNAGTLNGFDPADLVDWTQMTGIPADLADGDDDTLGGLVCTDGQVARWNGSAWSCADDAGQVFGRTFIVGPVGDPAANGSALLAAMAAIPPPASAAEAWLLKIEPGRYDLGTQTLQMKSRIDIEGSGRQATVITSAVCDSVTGTVTGSADTELRSLTVENLCTDPLDYGCGVSISEDRFFLDDVLIRTSGATVENYGVIALWAEQLTISNSRINVSNASDYNTGIIVYTYGGLEIRDVVSEANGNSNRADAADLRVYSGGSGPTFGAVIKGCTFRASSSSPSATAYGLVIGPTALDATVTDSVATATASYLSAGVLLRPQGGLGLTRLTRVQARGSATGITMIDNAVTQTHAILTDVSAVGATIGIDLTSLDHAVVSISGGLIAGGTVSVVDAGSTGMDAHISHTRIVGPTSLSSPASTCTAVTDGTPTFYASTCP